jgi:hypothetical protein
MTGKNTRQSARLAALALSATREIGARAVGGRHKLGRGKRGGWRSKGPLSWWEPELKLKRGPRAALYCLYIHP